MTQDRAAEIAEEWHASIKQELDQYVVDELAASIRAALAAAREEGRREAQEPLQAAMLQAHCGLLVLRTIMKRHGFTLGLEAAEDTLKHMQEVMPELPGLGSLRALADKEPT